MDGCVASDLMLGNARKGWEAELQLGFAPKNGKTLLAHRRHHGPLMVQKPFYPEGEVCHVYVLHPPGGVVSGDRLAIIINAEENSEALVTTPAAGKFYRSSGELAHQSILLKIAEGAGLEWLPQETIIYEGSRVNASLRIELGIHSRFIGWDVTVLGRPAANEGFTVGEAALNIQMFCANLPFYLERTILDPLAFAAPWGMNGHAALGTLLAYPATTENLETVREIIGDMPGRGVTKIGELLICRGLDNRADRLRSFFQMVWAHVRPSVMGRKACTPRIWAT